MGKLREETRAMRLLTQQAVEERAKLAAQALVRPGSTCHAYYMQAFVWPR